MLKIDNITVRYGQLTAVRGVTIEVAEGCVGSYGEGTKLVYVMRMASAS